MERFICQKNIEHFRELLASVTDTAQRRTILQLLAEEEARQFKQDHPLRPDGATH
jgi:hypothetical protein